MRTEVIIGIALRKLLPALLGAAAAYVSTAWPWAYAAMCGG